MQLLDQLTLFHKKLHLEVLPFWNIWTLMATPSCHVSCLHSPESVGICTCRIPGDFGYRGLPLNYTTLSPGVSLLKVCSHHWPHLGVPEKGRLPGCSGDLPNLDLCFSKTPGDPCKGLILGSDGLLCMSHDRTT